MSEFKKLDPDTAIDIAYDIFLEMAPENLDPADILLFNLQFEERGAVEFVETADNWEEEIGVLGITDYYRSIVTDGICYRAPGIVASQCAEVGFGRPTAARPDGSML